MEKTPEKKQGIFISGMVNAKSIYEGQKTTFYTLDIAVVGCRSLIPINVDPQLYSETKEGDIFSKRLNVTINKYGTKFSLC